MILSALVPWFGSKRNMASKIIQALGDHVAYWEPFCGSMAVLLEKPITTMETVGDLHGDLTNLARVIKCQELAPKLYGETSRIIPAESLYREAADRCKQRGHAPAGLTPDLERACDFFVCSWLGMNGVVGTKRNKNGFCRRFTKNGGHAATRWLGAVESIPEWHERLRHVVVLNACGFELLSRIEDAAKVVVYCDPPYIVKSDDYVHDFAQHDHQRLATALARFKKTRVVVSYYDHPDLAKLYKGWRKIDCTTTKALANPESTTGKRVAPEVLLINDSAATNLF